MTTNITKEEWLATLVGMDTTSRNSNMGLIETIRDALSAQGVEVLLDDRPKMSAGVKFADSELLGVPLVLVVGRGLAEGKVELRVRATGERRELPVERAADVVADDVRAALALA